MEKTRNPFDFGENFKNFVDKIKNFKQSKVYSISHILFLSLAIVCTISAIGWLAVRLYNSRLFYVNCESHINRAIHSIDIEVAKTELEKAINYAEQNNLDEGIISIFFQNPDNDMGFWCNNLKSAYNELDSFPNNASQLETSKLFERLNNSFTDGSFTGIRVPEGISIYPYNTQYFWWSIISLCGAVIFYILADIAKENDWL